MTRRGLLLGCAAGMVGRAWSTERVRVIPVPEGGLQPQAVVDEQGGLHLVYFSGDPKNGDVYYRGPAPSAPLRVNSQPGSAIALGTIRGAQLALGKGGRVHMAWNGSGAAQPPGPVNPDSGKAGQPMLYSRLNDAGTGFEPQRNLMLHSFGLDGGGSVAADGAGGVYVAWHGIGDSEAAGKQGEARRAVWITRSEDAGRTFAREAKGWTQATGACGCCGMKIFADAVGNVSVLYRSATDGVHRDIYLLSSSNRARTFTGRLMGKWDINACPMSSMDVASNGRETVGAWENGGQVYWARLSGGMPLAVSGEGKGRKHPRIAINGLGHVLLVWTEGTGWQKGGRLAWQIYDREGRADGEIRDAGEIPAWSFGAAVALSDGGFGIVS